MKISRRTLLFGVAAVLIVAVVIVAFASLTRGAPKEITYRAESSGTYEVSYYNETGVAQHLEKTGPWSLTVSYDLYAPTPALWGHSTDGTPVTFSILRDGSVSSSKMSSSAESVMVIYQG